MKEIQAIIRRERAERVLGALSAAGVARLWVSPVHSLGAGVDPEHYRLSMHEGAYSQGMHVRLVCTEEETESVVQVIRHAAGTGHRGDGVLLIREVERIISLRTGDEGVLALA